MLCLRSHITVRLCAHDTLTNRLQTKPEAVRTEELTTSLGWRTQEDAGKQRDVQEVKKVSNTATYCAYDAVTRASTKHEHTEAYTELLQQCH
jgi:hypothetical protein